MEGAKEMFLRMKEEDYNSLNTETRELFTYVEVRESDEYNKHKDDENYAKLYKAKRKASKAVQEYLFNKRHKS